MTNADLAISAGEQGLESTVSDDDVSVAKAYFNFKYDLPPSLADLVQSPLASSADKAWVYASEPEGDFSFLRVETLLNQTADILERALDSRRSFDDLSSRAATLALELKDFFETDEVHRDEVAKGIYTLSAKQSKKELDALDYQVSFLQVAIRETTNSLKTVQDYRQNLLDGAVVTALIPYLYINTDLNYGGDTRKIKDWAAWAAEIQSRASTEERIESLSGQIAELNSQLYAAEDRAAKARLQYLWDVEDISFKRRRTEVARDVARTKVLLSCLEEGPLNYAEQRDSTRLHFERDMGDALARFRALAKGLKLLYGYDAPDPMQGWVDIGKATKEELAATPFLGRIDPFVGWIRDALAWLIRFQAREVEYTKVLSIRQVVGEDDWKKGLTDGAWKFELGETEFPDQRHVRIRSISAAAVSAPDALWSALITLPSTGKAKHLDGSVFAIDQGFLPPLRFGRVTRRESVRPPETSSASLIHNTSPFGEWTLKIEPGASNAGAIAELDDFQLDLDVAVRQSTY